MKCGTKSWSSYMLGIVNIIQQINQTLLQINYTQKNPGHSRSTYKIVTGKSKESNERVKMQTSVSFWRGTKEATSDLGFGLSRGSYCRHLEAKRTSSVPSSFENWPSKQESINVWIFLSRIRSRAWKFLIYVQTIIVITGQHSNLNTYQTFWT